MGILSLRLADAAAAAEASVALERLAATAGADALVRDLDRGLRARLAWQAGDPELGLQLLDGLELGPASLGATNVVPFVARAHERFLRGDLLAELGRPEEALTWFSSLGELSVPESPYRALAHLRQAELHERLDNRNEAAEHYSRFVELWRASDPLFQPLLVAAQQRLALPEAPSSR